MTKSKADQLQTEAACAGLYGKQRHLDGTLQRERIVLHRDAHVAYLLSGLGQLSGAYSSLDASRPWLCYWIVHSLELIAPGSVPAELGARLTSVGVSSPYAMRTPFTQMLPKPVTTP